MIVLQGIGCLHLLALLVGRTAVKSLMKLCSLFVCFVLGCALHPVQRAINRYDKVAADVRVFRAEIHRLRNSTHHHALVCDEDREYKLTNECREQELAWYAVGIAATNANAAVDAYWYGRGTREECLNTIGALRYMYDVILKSRKNARQ